MRKSGPKKDAKKSRSSACCCQSDDHHSDSTLTSTSSFDSSISSTSSDTCAFNSSCCICTYCKHNMKCCWHDPKVSKRAAGKEKSKKHNQRSTKSSCNRYNHKPLKKKNPKRYEEYSSTSCTCSDSDCNEENSYSSSEEYCSCASNKLSNKRSKKSRKYKTKA